MLAACHLAANVVNEVIKVEINEILKIISYIAVGIGLFICTITDIRSKKIYLGVVIPVSIICIVLNIITGQLNLFEVISLIITGGLFIAISVISGGQLGLGDVCVYIMTGVGIGSINNIYLIFISFMIAALGAEYLMLVKKKGRKYQMPLAPYVLAGYIIYFVL